MEIRTTIYITKDMDGDVLVHTEKPELLGGCWSSANGDFEARHAAPILAPYIEKVNVEKPIILTITIKDYDPQSV